MTIQPFWINGYLYESNHVESDFSEDENGDETESYPEDSSSSEYYQHDYFYYDGDDEDTESSDDNEYDVEKNDKYYVNYDSSEADESGIYHVSCQVKNCEKLHSSDKDDILIPNMPQYSKYKDFNESFHSDEHRGNCLKNSPKNYRRDRNHDSNDHRQKQSQCQREILSHDNSEYCYVCKLSDDSDESSMVDIDCTRDLTNKAKTGEIDENSIEDESKKSQKCSDSSNRKNLFSCIYFPASIIRIIGKNSKSELDLVKIIKKYMIDTFQISDCFIKFNESYEQLFNSSRNGSCSENHNRFRYTNNSDKHRNTHLKCGPDTEVYYYYGETDDSDEQSDIYVESRSENEDYDESDESSNVNFHDWPNQGEYEHCYHYYIHSDSCVESGSENKVVDENSDSDELHSIHLRGLQQHKEDYCLDEQDGSHESDEFSSINHKEFINQEVHNDHSNSHVYIDNCIQSVSEKKGHDKYKEPNNVHYRDWSHQEQNDYKTVLLNTGECCKKCVLGGLDQGRCEECCNCNDHAKIRSQYQRCIFSIEKCEYCNSCNLSNDSDERSDIEIDYGKSQTNSDETSDFDEYNTRDQSNKSNESDESDDSTYWQNPFASIYFPASIIRRVSKNSRCEIELVTRISQFISDVLGITGCIVKLNKPRKNISNYFQNESGERRDINTECELANEECGDNNDSVDWNQFRTTRAHRWSYKEENENFNDSYRSGECDVTDDESRSDREEYADF